ncbi:MAG: hypothetical protein IKU15_04595 [Clostridia bacterium]|nr:hypothetical protein [Clostridia bacterium]
MYYIVISISALLFSLMFMFSEGFQKENGAGLNPTMLCTFYSAIFGLVLTLIVNKFQFNVSMFSFLVAIIYSVACVACNYYTIKALECGNLSTFTIFPMSGGLVLPFIFGLIIGEQFKVTRLICCILIMLSILLTVDFKSDSQNKTKSKKAIIYNMAVFLLNGSVGVISTLHQAGAQYNCVDSASFLMLSKIICIIIAGAFLIKAKCFRVSTKSLFYCGGNAAFNTLGNLLLLIALLHVPASVQFPIITGGTIVFSTVIDALRKVKVTKKQVLAAIVALCASCFMAF